MADKPPPQKPAGHSKSGDGGIAYLDRTLWRQLVEAETDEEFYSSWLGLQCRMINGVHSGIIVLGPPEKGPFAPVAFWPRELREYKSLAGVAERVLKERQGIVIRDESDEKTGSSDKVRFNVAYPDKTLVIVVIRHKKEKKKAKKGKWPGNIQIIAKKIMVSVPSVSPPI